MGIASKYVTEVRKQTGMTAVYPPNSVIRLGDYGRWEDDIFYPEGSLSTLATPIPFDTIVGNTELKREFKSSSVKKISLAANASATVGGVANAKARLELEFGSEFGIYVAVTGCVQSRIKDITGVGRKVMELRQAGQWDNRRRVVTSLMSAKNVTVIISRERNSKIVLEAEGNVPQIDLGDVGLSLRVVLDSTSSEQWITEKPDANGVFTPFCNLHGVAYDAMLVGKTWKPLAYNLTATTSGAALSPEDLAEFVEYRGEDLEQDARTDWEPL